MKRRPSPSSDSVIDRITTVDSLLAHLVLDHAPEEQQRAAIQEWLADNSPSDALREDLERHGYPVPPVSKGELLATLTQLVRFRLGVASAALLATGIALTALTFSPAGPPPDTFLNFLLRQTIGGLLVSGVGSFLLQLLLRKSSGEVEGRITRFVKEEVLRGLTGIKQDIAAQSRALSQGSASLEALRHAGVVRTYSNRGEASPDIFHDLSQPAVTEIYLMGISLNDFVRDDNRTEGLHRAWLRISDLVLGRAASSHPLDIRVLLIDPFCLGAKIRSFGEAKEPGSAVDRLRSDVEMTASSFTALADYARDHSTQTGVSFDFRLYRLPPHLFICSTNDYTYTQPYHFWLKRDVEPAPVHRFDNQSSLHVGILDHFHMVWNYASVHPSELLQGNSIGIETGSYESGAVNIFTHNDPTIGRVRIEWLLKKAVSRVDLQGFSLRQFLHPAGDLRPCIEESLRRGVRARVLLLDPDSEQAFYRSYREYLIYDPEAVNGLAFDEYRQKERLHRESRLYRETLDSIREASRLGDAAGGAIEAKLYASSPSAFILLVDDAAMVEQYHYGKILRDTSSTLLGKDMPLVEYSSTLSPVFERANATTPFRLLQDHFDFAFSAAKPMLDRARKSMLNG